MMHLMMFTSICIGKHNEMSFEVAKWKAQGWLKGENQFSFSQFGTTKTICETQIAIKFNSFSFHSTKGFTGMIKIYDLKGFQSVQLSHSQPLFTRKKTPFAHFRWKPLSLKINNEGNRKLATGKTKYRCFTIAWYWRQQGFGFDFPLFQEMRL